MVRLRFPRFGRQPRVEPSQPHRFREIDDPGMAAMASGGMGARGMTGPTQVIVTDNYLRKSNCGVPGCGRPRHHPIHEAAE